MFPSLLVSSLRCLVQLLLPSSIALSLLYINFLEKGLDALVHVHLLVGSVLLEAETAALDNANDAKDECDEPYKPVDSADGSSGTGDIAYLDQTLVTLIVLES